MGADSGRAPVVVAVADPDPADDAVEWAAAEAAVRATRLVVVHALRAVPAWDVGGLAVLADDAATARPLAAGVLARAARRAAAVAGDLEVSTELLYGSPAGALLARSRTAGLLVLGGRAHRRGRAPGVLAGRVAARARCPVAVVRIRPRTPAGPTRPRVVVGVDPVRCTAGGLEFAFRAAARRGVPLVAVHAWGGDLPADLEGVCGTPAAGEAQAGELLARVLGPWQGCFADVPVELRLVRGDPVAGLLAESRGAALVVVGSRGSGAPFGALRGSVGQALVRRCGCPTVVVRPDRPTWTWRLRTAEGRQPPAPGAAGPHRGRSPSGG